MPTTEHKSVIDEINAARITGNRNTWLAETAALLNESSHELVVAMSRHPDAVSDLVRVFGIVTNLSVDTNTLLSQAGAAPPNGPIDNGKKSADDGNMESRITNLEKDMAAVKTDVAVIRSNYVTKADLSALEATLLKWFIGTAVAMTALAFTAAKFIH